MRISQLDRSRRNSSSPTTSAKPATVYLKPRWWVSAAVVAVAMLIAALIFGGSTAARSLLDAGVVVRWALPAALMVNNLSAAAVIGSLIFAVVIVPRYAHSRGRLNSKDRSAQEHPAFARALLVAAVAAVVWTLAALAVLIESYLDQAGIAISNDPKFAQGLVYFVTDLPYGQAWAGIALIAAVVATLCFGIRSTTGLALTLVLALLALVPQALIGHSASSPDHDGAVNSLFLHIVGASVWIGGIIALGAISRSLTGTASLTAVVLKRFSALAFFAYFTVLASGVINALIRLTTPDQLFFSPYGQMVIAKTLLTLVLGVAGYLHRSLIIPQLQKGAISARRVLWQVIGVELVLLAATSALAVALSRSAPPQPTSFAPDTPPAVILSGYPMPPELTASRWLTEWRFDWIWVFVAVFAAVSYAKGAYHLRRRGDSWPILRTVSWMAGLLTLIYITCGAPKVYGTVLFSTHMIEHMALTMIAPIFLVMGAPMTLALKALKPRTDGSRGIREWLLALVHSWFGKLVSHPLFAAANFVLSIIVFYFSPLFGLALREHVGHELMIIHFLLTGYLFVLSMIGIDPVPKRYPYPMRLLLLLATMAFHAFFGVSIMSSNALLEASYFGNLGRDWGVSAIADQQNGGAIAWGIGEIPTVVVAVTVAIMWSRSDERESKRKDRAADRNKDADLHAYNDMFARYAQRDEQIGLAATTQKKPPSSTPQSETTTSHRTPRTPQEKP